MNTKAIFTIVALLAAVAVTGTIMGTQYVTAWHHGHHGKHGGYTSAMASGGGGGSMPSSGGMSSSGGGGGGY
jgi:hypothetical protein